MKNVISIFILLVLTLNPVCGFTEVTVNEVNRPGGAVLFIVDGLGSSYFYPEFEPQALDGTILLKARNRNLTPGARVLDIEAPRPVTGIGHSVIVTGYSNSNEEITGFPDATIFDITRKHGYMNIAVMQKGDFSNMRQEQDIIIFAENNSIDQPLISIQTSTPNDDIHELMYEWRSKFPVYLNNRSGVDRYSAYNKWGIDTANAILAHILSNNLSRKFLLTVNIGAIDSGGHNLGDDDYIRLIEDLDRDFYPLYETAVKNNIALFLTSDHGMSFAKMNARRGGHISDKYRKRPESLRIPFVINSPNVVDGTMSGKYGQEDIAPTILSVLDLPGGLQYGDGEPIGVKNYGSIFVESDPGYSVSLWNNGKKISGSPYQEFVFSGLSLNERYTIKASGPDKDYEENVVLDSDKKFIFIEPEPIFTNRELVAIILILIVNITGFIIIKRIKD